MRTLLLLFLSVPLWCQISEVAVSDDGQQIFFTTTLVERNASANTRAESRIFQLIGRQVRLFAERGELARTDAFGSGDGASSLQMSGDGQSVAFTLLNICPPGETCNRTIQRAEIRGPSKAQVLGDAYRVRLSRNGKWALLVPSPFSSVLPGGPPQQNTTSTLINLETGERSSAGYPVGSASFVLASDGSVLQQMPLGISKGGQLKQIPPIAGGVGPLALSDDGNTLIASVIEAVPYFSNPPRLVAVDLRDGSSKNLASMDTQGRYILLGMSNDGRVILVQTLSAAGFGPVQLIDTRGPYTSTLALADGEVPVSRAVSGTGDLAIVATSAGRIVRFTNGNPVGEEILPATPYVSMNGYTAPGALVKFRPPLPGISDWTGRIRLNDFALGIVGQSSSEITAQVPWELTSGTATIGVDAPSDSPLVQKEQVLLTDVAPSLGISSSPGTGIFGGMLIKGDFSGFVTDPPKAGDVVHMYFTGLGPVRGKVETGKPAPLDDLRPTLYPAQCRFMPHPSEAETLFSGLAPGMIGIYQVSFRMPADTPSGVAPNGMECRFGTSGFSFRQVGAPLVAP